MSLLVPISWGELLDKISILEIKKEKIEDLVKLKNINHELNLLRNVRDREIILHEGLDNLCASLKEVNEMLWEIEDAIRICEKNSDFGEEFIRLARAVYKTNDRRAHYKYKINAILGSDVVEEKSYEEY